ncbi:DUF2599 domain-containing protein [Photorhabdus hindustanensis]|uniref:DUF2599 domain-containing protein n=2 Tax=Photorhabdus TaxID=29487 RepID=A0A2S8R1N4_9GAMM|nr:DUF2599 domain-containing protein [Photorhabdus hindustanensis]PQQ41485.1 DUF2599 domain-containing protein [Photorhabdus luminescens]
MGSLGGDMKRIGFVLLVLFFGMAVFPASANNGHNNCRHGPYIESGKWIKRFGKMTLAVVPTKCGRNLHFGRTNEAFKELERKFSNSPHWYNTKGMRNQFDCHVDIARNKDKWNLDPYRKHVGYSATKKAGCNP